MAILSVRTLHKAFTLRKRFWSTKQSFVAVRDVSFDLQEGQIVGLLGTNGAGKTTTIQMLLGTLAPTSGSIQYFGKDFFTHAHEVLQHIACASGYDRLPGTLTVWQNLDVFARIYGISAHERKQRINAMLASFDMMNMRDRRAGTLSAGQATRLLLAKAFLPSPKIVLLDEPTASLDPTMAAQVRAFVLQQAREQGTSILFSSHNMDEVTQVCDRVLVMKQGTIIADSNPAQLAGSIKIAHIHLFITQGREQLLAVLNERQLMHSIDENLISIAIEEHDIAAFLSTLAQQNICYATISIDKATLEDYFLSVSS